MTQLQPLPRTYWCQRSYHGPGFERLDPQRTLTLSPGRAVVWMRDSVRGILSGLDSEALGIACAWLSDQQAAGTAVQELHQGRSVTFTLPTGDSRWNWSAYPVFALPLTSNCPNSATSDRHSVPSDVTGGLLWHSDRPCPQCPRTTVRRSA
ncbi:hypothetical protein [Streptomyces pinistramenti]|uniref:hypothetical protein n=1 Tax=Streptomyces pinistramenti TaxID=2884812 RepID=UPI001D093759|nr:hypothetical protein [Streptomyces pinistramenti]MCB5911059.1 hypothetical protein [Streptomyces pinistramenti]